MNKQRNGIITDALMQRQHSNAYEILAIRIDFIPSEKRAAVLKTLLERGYAVHLLDVKERMNTLLEGVDEAGQSLVIGPATASTVTDPQIIGFQLQAYVRDVRQITADGSAQKNLLERVYRQTAGPAIGFLNDHFRASDPFLAARSQTVMPSVRNTLQLGDRTWQVEWVEAHRTLDGTLRREETWVGQFEVIVEPPTTPEEIVTNPLGFKVTRAAWSRKF